MILQIILVGSIYEQECIPVGCIPPACYHMARLPDRDTPGQRPPPGRDLPPGQKPLGGRSP